MDRVEATGFGVAAAGHVMLLGVLSLGFASATRPPLVTDSIEVAFVDEIGLKAAVTEAETEAPAEAEAPVAGPPEEAIPAPAETPPEPKPAPQPKAAVPTPEPKPKKEKQPVKAAPARPAPKKAAPSDSEASAKGSARQARASRIGSDLLKGLADPGRGKATAPRAAVSSRNMAGLAQAIIAQVKPCYVVPTGGTDSGSIETVLRLRLREDGSVATPPAMIEQNGVTSANRPYARQMADAAKRAVLRCSPLKLPPDLYEGGWEDITFGFRAEAMG